MGHGAVGPPPPGGLNPTAAPPPVAEARIPFTVIGGFLGAGKTTLLKHWLTHAAGRRLAVLVNDFGELNLDAELIAQAGGDAVGLSNGCVCCSIGDDLSGALIRLLDAWPPFDAVVVEASGVSDPWRIAQYALADPRLRLDGVLLLVDAAAVAAQAQDPLLADTLARPLAHADLVLLNKADLATPAELAAAHAWLAAHAPAGIAMLETVQADLPPDLLGATLYQPKGTDWARATTEAGAEEADAAETDDAPGAPTSASPPRLAPPPVAHDRRFEAWACAPAGRYDPARLRAWLRALPPGVLRLKALLPAASGGWLEAHWAGRHPSLKAGAPPPEAGAQLVAIGLAGQLPRQALETGLRACRA